VWCAHTKDFPKMDPLHIVQYLLYFHVYSQCSIAKDAKENRGEFPCKSETLCHEKKN